MKRYKYVKECKEGDWVYNNFGELAQVIKSDINPNEFCLATGYIRSYFVDDTIVYPLTMHSKIIAERIYEYYDDMIKNGLINGSRWVNWLFCKFNELMELDDDVACEEYYKIYDEIEKQIKELKYHKSFLS